MPAPALEGRLRDVLVPHIEGLGYECIELSFAPEAGRRVLRITVDAPGGVTLAQCAAVSRAVAPALEAIEELPGRYVLEVSSPGINRPLVTAEHFRRFLGEPAKIRLKEKQDGAQTITGVLRRLDGDVLTLETSVGEKKVQLGAIARARLHRDVDAILRAAKRTSSEVDAASRAAENADDAADGSEER